MPSPRAFLPVLIAGGALLTPAAASAATAGSMSFASDPADPAEVAIGALPTLRQSPVFTGPEATAPQRLPGALTISGAVADDGVVGGTLQFDGPFGTGDRLWSIAADPYRGIATPTLRILDSQGVGPSFGANLDTEAGTVTGTIVRDVRVTLPIGDGADVVCTAPNVPFVISTGSVVVPPKGSQPTRTLTGAPLRKVAGSGPVRGTIGLVGTSEVPIGHARPAEPTSPTNVDACDGLDQTTGVVAFRAAGTVTFAPDGYDPFADPPRDPRADPEKARLSGTLSRRINVRRGKARRMRMTVHNRGGQDATNVRVRIRAPRGVTVRARSIKVGTLKAKRHKRVRFSVTATSRAARSSLVRVTITAADGVRYRRSLRVRTR
ncbi:MAG: NEW3 domain-containing protein [Solirubrobacteraceae bacterium]